MKPIVAKWLWRVVPCVFLLCMTTGCIDEDEYPDNPRRNMEALWRIIDEHYCFLDLKKTEYGLDWNEVHARYLVRVNDGMSKKQ